MRLSRRGAKFIASFEGFRATPYRAHPSEEFLTIGFGHYGPDVRLGMRWSRAKGLRVLRRDAADVTQTILRTAPRGMALEQHELDALVSAGYNLGAGVFDRTRSLGSALRAGNRKGIAAAFPLYVFAGGERLEGLVRRRSAEKRLFRFGYRRKRSK